MSDVTSTLWVIASFIVLGGCIPYGISLIRNLVKRRWRRLGIQIAIPVVAVLILVGVSAVANAFAYKHYLEGLYDAKAEFGSPTFQYDSKRAFNGDGYSISVYELPASIRARFEVADGRLLTEFPKRPSYRNDWKFEHWREAPFDGKFDVYLDFALSSLDADRAAGLTEQFKHIREALARKGTYYAFFYNNPGDYPGDIDFFIVDLVGGRVYSINHNT